MWETWVRSQGLEDALEECMAIHSSILAWRIPMDRGIWQGYLGGSDSKEPTCNVGDLGSIPGLGRSPGVRKGYPLQYSGLENSTDCIVHGVAKTQLSDFHFQTSF